MLLYLEPYNVWQSGADGSCCFNLHIIICGFVIHSVSRNPLESLSGLKIRLCNSCSVYSSVLKTVVTLSHTCLIIVKPDTPNVRIVIDSRSGHLQSLHNNLN